MNEMIERVARAYRAKIVEFVPTIPNDITDPIEPQELELARAAIEAMREPTYGMLKASAKLHGAEEVRAGVGIDCFLPLNCYRAMIDVALKDEP